MVEIVMVMECGISGGSQKILATAVAAAFERDVSVVKAATI